MSRVPPPWVIEEVDRARRQHSERERPRLEIPRPPPPPRSGDDAPGTQVIIVIDFSAAGALAGW